MKLIYVCSPYRGDFDKNVRNAQKACRKVVDSGNVPIAPHLFFPQFLNEETEREIALELNKRLIDVCDVLCVFGNEISEGMQIEIDYANSIGKKVMYCGI